MDVLESKGSHVAETPVSTAGFCDSGKIRVAYFLPYSPARGEDSTECGNHGYFLFLSMVTRPALYVVL